MFLENLEYSEFEAEISTSDVQLYSIIQNLQKVMADETRKVLIQADHLAKKLISETEKDRKLRGHLLDTAKKVQKIMEQSEAVNAVNTKLADRLISLRIQMPAP